MFPGFTDDDRKIFEFTAGGEARCVDPLAADLALSEAVEGQDLADLFARAASGERGMDAVLCRKQVLRAVRTAFDLPAFDPRTRAGVTDAEALGVYARFAAWSADLGKAPAPSPTCSAPTGADSSPAPCPTGPSSASG